MAYFKMMNTDCYTNDWLDGPTTTCGSTITPAYATTSGATATITIGGQTAVCDDFTFKINTLRRWYEQAATGCSSKKFAVWNSTSSTTADLTWPMDDLEVRTAIRMWNQAAATWVQKEYTQTPTPPGERLREIIRARQAPLYLPSHRRLLVPTDDPREVAARATFRRIVGEHNWRTYCARGHVSVRAASGRVYQLFAGHQVARAYQGGKLVERLCIVLRDAYTPTDTLLARYVLLLSDEAKFRRIANITKAYDKRDHAHVRPAPETDLATAWSRHKALRAGCPAYLLETA